MSSILLTNILRFVGLVLLQVLILNGILLGDGWLGYINFFIYPLFLFLLPHDTPHWALILLGLLVGLTVDVFYSSYGIHAAAGTFTGFMRPIVLKWQEPKGGYTPGQSPTRYRLGMTPYLRYTSIMMILHLSWFFSMKIFIVTEIRQIILRTIVAFLVSMILIILHAVAINPKN